MKGLFHKRVPSFSFTSFTFNKDSKQSAQPTPEPRSQPSSPREPHFDLHPLPEPPHSAALPSDHPSQFLHQQQSRPRSPTPTPSHRHTSSQTSFNSDSRSPSRPRSGSITIVVSPTNPLELTAIDNRPKSLPPVRRRRASLVDTLMDSDRPVAGGSRRGSLVDSLTEGIATLATDRGRSGGPSGLVNRHRMRWPSLFHPLHYHPSSRSPSPASRKVHERGWESDPESLLELRSHDSESEDSSETHGSGSDDETAEEPSGPEDETIVANTTANASALTPIDFLQTSDQPVPFIDQAPNLAAPPPPPISFASADPRRQNQAKTRKASLSSRSLRRNRSTHAARKELHLAVSRPIYEKNRCTIHIEHGDWAGAVAQAERTRSYLVACDLSEESKYAIEWTIGTVLRQGDECLIIMIIETESKLDPEGGAGSVADRTAKIRNQKDRQEKATLLVREATALLERTWLNVKVTCQAVHAKNTKHMLIDCIDYLEPNLVVVGSRGLTSLKGNLMGSVSHYLVQKSSVPVMVARRRLRTLPKVYKKKAGLARAPRRKLEEAAIEKTPSRAPVDGAEPLAAVGEDVEKEWAGVEGEVHDLTPLASPLPGKGKEREAE